MENTSVSFYIHTQSYFFLCICVCNHLWESCKYVVFSFCFVNDLKAILLNFLRRCEFLSALKNLTNLSSVLLKCKMVFARNFSRVTCLPTF